MTAAEDTPGDDAAPLFSVLAGTPTAGELAALIGILAVRSAAVPAADDAPVPSVWQDRGRTIGAPPFPGPGAWRASGLPR